MGLPSAVTPISILVPTQHVCHATAVGYNSCTVEQRRPQQSGAAWYPSPSRFHPRLFLSFLMLSHACETCEMTHVCGSGRLRFQKPQNSVVDCGGSRVSISGKRLLEYERADERNEIVMFCIISISNSCLPYLCRYFGQSAFQTRGKKCNNFF